MDTTGAGDAFDAGLLVAWLRGGSPRKALLGGVRAGAAAISRAGAWPASTSVSRATCTWCPYPDAGHLPTVPQRPVRLRRRPTSLSRRSCACDVRAPCLIRSSGSWSSRGEPRSREYIEQATEHELQGGEVLLAEEDDGGCPDGCSEVSDRKPRYLGSVVTCLSARQRLAVCQLFGSDLDQLIGP